MSQSFLLCRLITSTGPCGRARSNEPVDVRINAVKALGAIRNNISEDTLLRAARSDQPSELRVAAIHALSFNRSNKVYSLLAESMKDGKAEVKLAALEVLGNQGNQDARRRFK